MREVISVSLHHGSILRNSVHPFRRSTLAKPVREQQPDTSIPCQTNDRAGVQIGNACWELYTIEHGLSVSLLCYSTLLYNGEDQLVSQQYADDCNFPAISCDNVPPRDNLPAILVTPAHRHFTTTIA